MEKKSAEQLAKEFIDNMSSEDIESIKNVYAETIKNLIVKAQNKVDEINSKIEILKQEKIDTSDIGRKTEIYDEINKLEKTPNFYKNLIKCYENVGESISFTDKRGVEHSEIPNFEHIKTDKIIFDEETLLEDDVPPYIPFIDEDKFRQKGYVFDAIRIGKNQYLLAVNGYSEKNKGKWNNKTQKEESVQGHPTDAQQGYILVTLDQLVLINDYYYTKAKATKIKEAKERNKRSEDYYDKLPLERREKFLNQKDYWNSLPKAIQKKITKVDYELLSLSKKEALYKPFKKYNPERLKAQLDTNTMWQSFHAMYERFLNPDALPMTKDKRAVSINESRIGIYGNPEVFAYWYWFVDMMKWKLNDIKVQREIESEIRKIALETSFGESNTNLELKEKYGILVKRQNGSQIQPTEINQIKDSWVKVQDIYGGLSHIALNDNLKISHTADKYCYASKAAGMYIPKMKTIAVSNKYGNEKFQCIMAHEVAHYIDNRIGETKGERYSTDNYEGISGVIANKFRNLMNKKSDSDYINSTKECFARALEQYFAVSVFGENVTFYESKIVGDILYFNADSYVNKANFDDTIKPLIKQFLDEEKSFFKYLVELNNENTSEIIKTEEPNEIAKAIETFEMLIELGGTDAELKEWNEAVETFKMLVDDNVVLEKNPSEITFNKDEKIIINAVLNNYKISAQSNLDYYTNGASRYFHEQIRGNLSSYISDAKKSLEDINDTIRMFNDKNILFLINDKNDAEKFLNEYNDLAKTTRGKELFNNEINGKKYYNIYLDLYDKLENYIENKFDVKMKDGGYINDDFDWMSIYKEETPEELELRLKQEKISEEQQKENEYQKGKWSKKYAPTYKDAVKKMLNEYKSAKKTYEDWGSRIYKTNKGNVFIGGDDVFGESKNIGSINENRKKRVMMGAKMQMDESIENLQELGLTMQEIKELLEKSEHDKNVTLSLF